jgi:hypothetical protein
MGEEETNGALYLVFEITALQICSCRSGKRFLDKERAPASIAAHRRMIVWQTDRPL